MKRIFLTGALAGALFLQSCTDDDLINRGGGTPPAPGTPVTFGAGLDTEGTASRTIYGEFDEASYAFPIYWGHPDDNNKTGSYDNIYIYSSKSSGAKYAQYQVTPPISEHKDYAPVKLVGENGIAVGADDGVQDFYAFYPYSAVDGGNLPGETEQKYVYVNMPASRKVTVPATATDGVYYASSDMNLCYMRAAHPNYQLVEDEPVQLQFKPWSTVLNITIPGPSSGSSIVTGVVVKSICEKATYRGFYNLAPPIAGRFKCPLDDSPIEFDTSQPDNLSNSYVSVDIFPEGSDKGGFTLEAGKSLNLKVFLAPSADVNDIDIEVQTIGGYDANTNLPTDSRVWIKSLQNADESTPLLNAGQIHTVILPQIGSQDSDGVRDLSRWMSELPDDMPITNLSIPGAQGGYDFTDSDTYYPAQYEEVGVQFDAGIRAFDMCLYHNVLTDSYVGINPSLMNYNSVGRLGDFLYRLIQVMQSKGSTEFVILNMSVSLMSYYGSTMVNTLNSYIKYLEDSGMLPQRKEGYTVGDLRGKILVNFNLIGDPNMALRTSEYDWNYGQNPDGEDSSPSSEKGSFISPLSNIQRLLVDTESTEIYSWDTVDSSPFKDAYTNATPVVKDGLFWWWKNINNGRPCSWMFSYVTETSITKPTVTPVSFGKIGDLNYTPSFSSLDEFNASTADFTRYDDYFDNTTYPAPVYTGYPTPPASSEKAGLRWMHAYVLWKNMEKVGTQRGMMYDNIWRSLPDMRLWKLIDNQYPLLRDNSNQYYLLQGYYNVYHNSDQAVLDQQSKNSDMWGETDQFSDFGSQYTGKASLEVYRSIFGNKLFAFTNLGYSHSTGSNYQLNQDAVEYWLGLVCDGFTPGETPTVTLKQKWNNIPLGVVFMPFIPDRATVLSTGTTTGYRGARRRTGIYVRKIVDMMVQHSKDCANLP